MRRTLFYLSVALLAFGLGSFVVFEFCWSDEKLIVETINNSNVEKIRQMPEFNRQNIKSLKRKENFKCEDQFLLAVWNYLRKDKDLKEIFDRGVQTGELSDCLDVIGIDKLDDLNNDGESEAFINGKGWLNGLDERRIWIVGKIGGNYKVILEADNIIIETVEDKTNNYADLIGTEKISIPEYEKTVFQFSGDSYTANKCWTEIIAARKKMK